MILWKGASAIRGTPAYAVNAHARGMRHMIRQAGRYSTSAVRTLFSGFFNIM